MHNMFTNKLNQNQITFIIKSNHICTVVKSQMHCCYYCSNIYNLTNLQCLSI